MYNLTILINAWAKSSDPQAPERAETILHEAAKLHNEGVLDLPPNSVSYSSVLECYSKSSKPGAAERAAAILNEMDLRSRRGETHLRPNDVSYRHVMAAFAARGMVQETEETLDKMLDEIKKGNRHAIPTARTMNLALTALSNSNDPNAGSKALLLLKRMEQLHGNQKVDGKPDVVSYTLALKCISNSPNQSGGEEAERLLSEMETRASQGETSLAPNTMTYSTLIQIYGRAGLPEKAEAVLERMHQKHQEGIWDVTPNKRTFTSVLQAWARSRLRGKTERALAILERMKELHNHGVLHDVKPNFITYAAVLSAMASSNRKEDCSRAMQLLDEMEQLAEKDPDVAPNDVAWNFALKTFANIGDGIKAQECLAKMYHKFESGVLATRPSTTSWQTVVEAWTRSRDPNAPHRVLAIWKRMEELHDEGVLDQRPNAKIYVLMLECFSKSTQKDVRKHIGPTLEELDKAMLDGTQHSLNMFDNLRIVRALTRLKDDDMLVKAEGVLRRMIKHYDKGGGQWNPNAIKASFSALIASWSKSRDKLATDHVLRLQRELETMRPSFG